MTISQFFALETDYLTHLNQLVDAVNSTTDAVTGIEAGAVFNGTSTTSNSIGTGSKTFALAETGRAWAVGAVLRVAVSTTPSSYMIGTVTAYGGTSLTLDITSVAGSGSYANWSIGLEGVTNTNTINQGQHCIWLPAAAWTSRLTNGPVLNSFETSTHKVMAVTLDFDATTAEYAQIAIQMPPSWDHGELTGIPVWKHAATTTNFGVVWALQGQALSNDDSLDSPWGTAQTSTDSGGTTNDVYRGPQTSAIALANTPTQNDMVLLQCYRDTSNGNDTLAVDAGLIGWLLFYGVNNATDA